MSHLGGIAHRMALGDAISNVAGKLDDPAHLAALVANGVVGGLQPDRIAMAVAPQEEPGLELPLGQLFPEAGVLLIEGVIAQDPVIAPLELVQGVTDATQEVGVGREDVAGRGELDHGKRAFERLGDRLLTQQLLMLGGDVAGDLDHLGHPALRLYREVAGLQPDHLAPLVAAREDAGLDPALLELGPELLVLGGAGQLLAAKHSVVLTLQLHGAVTHQAQKWLIGLQDLAIRGEDDGRDPGLDRLHEAL